MIQISIISIYKWDVITHPCPNFTEVRAWISNYIPQFYVDVIPYPCHKLAANPWQALMTQISIISIYKWDVITHSCPNFTEVRAWISNYIPQFYVDVIPYPCHKLAANPWQALMTQISIISIYKWDVITHSCPNFTEVRAWISNYITQFYVDVIPYPCPKLAANPWHPLQ